MFRRYVAAGVCERVGLSSFRRDLVANRVMSAVVAHIDALQIEYSPWYTDHEGSDLIDTARELGVTIVASSPLGKSVLTGQYSSPE